MSDVVSPPYDYFILGTYSGGVFTKQIAFQSKNYFDYTGTGTDVLVYISSDGGSTYQQEYSGAGVGHASDNGVEYPLITFNGKYYLSSPTALSSYAITQGTYAPACYCSGTRIRTKRGSVFVDVTVEDLVSGDLAVTASGAHRPIKWIGHRITDCSTLDAPHAVWPVRILAGAFGGDLPERDLWLSPGHPVLVGEHLVPIMCLINGTSIDRVKVDSVTYWHIELDAHDLLLAEGLPAESFLDFGNRPWFGADAEVHALANPDFIVPGLGARCRPVAVDGPIVESERRRLDALFATRLSEDCGWPSDEDVALGV